MNERTLNALNESIKHWQRYVDGFGKEEGEPLVFNCSLCRVFYRYDCVGCPIRERTGRINCHGTPYGDAYDAYGNGDTGPTSPEFIGQAKLMLEFLKSLLPVDNTTSV